MTKKIYFENLDGLRFFCFLSVFLFHSFHTDYDHIRGDEIYQLIKWRIFGHGNIGVNFFFVLSGFLITYLLIQEKKLNGQIDLKKFWLRRVLRIWPLFYACVLFGFFGFPLLKSMFGEAPEESASIGYYLTFLNNFDFIKKGPPDASILGVLWSIAIEEQFYLVWPIILYWLPVKKYWIPFCVAIGGSWLFRSVYDNAAMYEFHTLSCIGDLAIGAMGAWLVSEHEEIRNTITNMNRSYIFLIYAVLVFIFFFRHTFSELPAVRIFERSLIAVVMLLIILEQNYARKSFFKLSRFSIISKLGVISYGLYCLHFIGILITTTLTDKFGLNTHLWQVLLIDTGIALLVTVTISFISYNFYEKPFLKIKEKLSYIRRQ